MFVAEIEGIPEVLNKLHEKFEEKAKGVERGLKKAGLQLLRWSQQIVPVDKGQLRASGFVRMQGHGFNAAVQVGYTAAYAIFVHEKLDAVHGSAYNDKYARQISNRNAGFHTRGPNQQAKFLEKPAREHSKELKNIIKEEASA